MPEVGTRSLSQTTVFPSSIQYFTRARQAILPPGSISSPENRGRWKTAQPIRHLPHKHEDLSLNLQSMHEAGPSSGMREGHRRVPGS